MRIALLTQQLTETAFAHGYAALSKGFWDLGIRDQHILYIKEEHSEKIIFPPGVKIYKSNFNRISLSPVWIAKYIQESKPDVLISMPVFINIAAIVGKLLSRENQPKLIVSERAILSYYLASDRIKNLRYQLLPLFLNRLYPKVDGLVANNSSVLEDLKVNFKIPLVDIPTRVIPPAIDIEAINILKGEEPDKEFCELLNKPILISVGRLAKEKNFQLLLHAFKIIRQSIDVRLIIFGNGPERENLEKLICKLRLEEVYLPGYVDNPWSIMAKSDVFVLSSQKEAFGRVLIEAMVCGLPIVATDAIGSGPRFILNNGECGYLVERKNEVALAEAIIQLLNTAPLREKFIECGKIRCQEFMPSSVAEKWLSLIDDVTN